jgi:hypothetical protein
MLPEKSVGTPGIHPWGAVSASVEDAEPLLREIRNNSPLSPTEGLRGR